MGVKTDTTGNHVGPDLTKYDWEYVPISGATGGYDFRLVNYEKCVEVEVYPENDDPDEGYNIVVREFEIVNEGTPDEYIEEGYPVFPQQTGPYFMEMMSALATAVTWVSENRE
ncbi:hypothetical protein [Hardygib1 virus]|nr:hypothetical protein [Hardygib1 virus]